MPRLLHVLGGGPWQVPTVRAAKAMGLRVLVTDMHSDRPAYALADAHEVADIADVAETLAVARRHKIDGIVCDTTDTGVFTAAAVAEAMGLPGIGGEVARRFTDKSALREGAAQCGAGGGAWRVVGDASQLPAAADAVGWPLVVKPVDSQSGRGVCVIAARDQLANAYEQARQHSPSRRVLLEAFVHGQEYIVDGFVVDGQVHLLAIASKHQYADNPTLSARILYLSGAAFEAAARALEPVNRRVLAALGLRQGIFHAEYIADGTRAVPIDIAARGGGVMIYTHVLPHVAGVDAVQTVIRMALGEPVQVLPRAVRRGASIDFLRLPAGHLAGITGVQDALRIGGVAAIHLNAQPGDAIGALTMKDDRPGFIVSLAEDSEQAVAAGIAARSCLRATMANRAEPFPVN